MAADFVTRWADFSGGDYGQLDPARAKSNQFRATNMFVYETGLLGPRPGLKQLPVTGLPGHNVVPGPVGFDVWDDDIVIVLGQPYRVPVTDPAPAAIEHAAYTTTPSDFVRFAEHSRNLYSTADGNLYKHVLGTTGTTAIPLPPGVKLDGLVRWGYQLLGWDRDVPWRIWYSTVGEAGAQPDNWGVNNFLDVGSNEPITKLVPLYNYLMVGKKSGWWAVSGVLAERPYVRSVSLGNGPVDQRACAVTTDNRILYWGVEEVPHWFNGENSYFDDNQRVSGFETVFPSDTVVATPTGRKTFMLGEPLGEFTSEDAATEMLMNREGKWTTHEFAVPLGGMAGSDLRTGYTQPNGVTFMIQRPRTVGDPVVLMSFDHDLERPGHTDDRWAQPTDPNGQLIEGYVEFPAYYDAQSRMVLVRSVVVQFRKWPSGVTDAINELQCLIRPLGRYEAGGIESHSHLWSEPCEAADTDGTDDSWRIGTGWQGWANGFQVVFPRVRGVAIRAVEVHAEVRTARL